MICSAQQKSPSQNIKKKKPKAFGDFNSSNKQRVEQKSLFFLPILRFFFVVAGKVEKQNLVNLDSNRPLDPGSISIQQSNNTHEHNGMDMV